MDNQREAWIFFEIFSCIRNGGATFVLNMVEATNVENVL